MSFRDNLKTQAAGKQAYDLKEYEQRYLQACNEWARGILTEVKSSLEASVEEGDIYVIRRGLREIRYVETWVAYQKINSVKIPDALRQRRHLPLTSWDVLTKLCKQEGIEVLSHEINDKYGYLFRVTLD